MKTHEAAYVEQLTKRQQALWKRIFDVQLPYRMHIRALRLGSTLDVGCGNGRNLAALGRESVGVDHSVAAIEIARGRGFSALSPADFLASPHAVPDRFDALLLAHVAEHMTSAAAVQLLREYLPFVRSGGRVVLITPQEVGFRSDPTHVEFMDFARVATIVRELGLDLQRQYSFPFPRVFGRLFKYNEFISIARKRAGRGDSR